MSWAWASGSSSRFAAALLLVCAAAVTPSGEARARVFHSQREALELAFPDAERIERRNLILTEAQATRIEERSRAPLESRIVTVHVGWRDGKTLGYVLIDVHTVRTLPEALMVVLTPEGQVRSVRVLAFHEPEDYLPTGRWLGQFERRKLDPDLQLRRDIHAIAGATLSSRAATRSVRRSLAVYEVLLAGSVARSAAE
jgi:hypothetical protein